MTAKTRNGEFVVRSRARGEGSYAWGLLPLRATVLSSKPKSHILRALSNEKIKRGNGFIYELGGVGKTVISGWGAVQ